MPADATAAPEQEAEEAEDEETEDETYLASTGQGCFSFQKSPTKGGADLLKTQCRQQA